MYGNADSIRVLVELGAELESTEIVRAVTRAPILPEISPHAGAPLQLGALQPVSSSAQFGEAKEQLAQVLRVQIGLVQIGLPCP